MTGEAFPGYLPYPTVARDISTTLPGVRIVAIVRDPLQRALSSYHYNYVRPALEMIRKNKVPRIPAGKSDEYYKANYLFSFEEMAQAELTLLKECLAVGGEAQSAAKETYKSWFEQQFAFREANDLPALRDVELCYGAQVSETVPRKQWIELVNSHPKYIINTPNFQLTEAIVGRGLYVTALEWWYAIFPKEDVHVICLEQLNNGTKAMDDLTSFLGLPTYNFSDTLATGFYNVEGHEGYDTLTTEETTTTHDDIEVSESLRQELLDFFAPYNEQLFGLIGKRCSWQ